MPKRRKRKADYYTQSKSFNKTEKADYDTDKRMWKLREGKADYDTQTKGRNNTEREMQILTHRQVDVPTETGKHRL